MDRKPRSDSKRKSLPEEAQEASDDALVELAARQRPPWWFRARAPLPLCRVPTSPRTSGWITLGGGGRQVCIYFPSFSGTMFPRALAPIRAWLERADARAGRLGYAGVRLQDVSLEKKEVT